MKRLVAFAMMLTVAAFSAGYDADDVERDEKTHNALPKGCQSKK